MFFWLEASALNIGNFIFNVFILQVATGLSFTVILTRHGHVYTCGSNTHGQLGHGDTIDRPTPKKVESLEGLGDVIQVSAGTSYTLAVTKDGTLHSFGYCSNFCLGHGDQHDELLPRAIQSFKRRNIHVISVSAGDEHAVALDSSGHVSLSLMPMNYITYKIFTIASKFLLPSFKI